MDILLPGLVLAGLGFVLGLSIFIVSKYFHVEEDPHIAEVVDLLPRYNCGACGHPGCKEMAVSLLKGESKPNQCKPIKPEAVAVLEEYLKKYYAEQKKA